MTGHPRKKKVHKSPSVVHNSDPPFPEPSPSGDDSESTTGVLGSDSQATETLKTTAAKHKRHKPTPPTPKDAPKFTYILSILSATEAKKAIANRSAKTATVCLD
jgi:hypothetical protein